MTRTLAALTVVATLLFAIGLPHGAAAQQPYYPYQPVQQPQAPACPGGGAQPLTTSFVDSASLFGGTVVSPFGFGTFGFNTGFFNTGFVVATVVTTTQNYQGVQGLTQTVINDSFSTPTVSLGVPDYLFQAYGGNITAIQRDLAAGFLKCRTS
jgi:hypothetical protein